MRVRFTTAARLQVEEIVAYIARDSRGAAARVRKRIEDVARLLGENPGMGYKTSDRGVKMFVVRPYPYLVFFEVMDNEVVILTVRHGARRRPAFHEPDVEFVPATF